MARLDGRRVWVTGGGRGIGRAIAIAMARQEADVAVSAVQNPKSTTLQMKYDHWGSTRWL